MACRIGHGHRRTRLPCGRPPTPQVSLHLSEGPHARNPRSTAFGLGQLLLGQRLRYLGAGYATTDCARQLGAFRAYVRDRYGSAEAAMAFWLAHQWY
jgi:hypothetical protein